MDTGYVVGDIMSTKPVSCKPDVSVKEAAMLLMENDIRSVLVVDGGRLVGIVTDKDFVYRSIAQGLDPQVARIEEIMSPKRFFISPDKDLSAAVEMMNKHNIHHLPVLEGEKLVGYLTMSNIMKVEPQLLEIISEKARIRSLSPDSPLAHISEEL